jgi:serine-type D-Ala-D-Ala carboxypeptidase (penicillin-binding protein 5/6)
MSAIRLIVFLCALIAWSGVCPLMAQDEAPLETTAPQAILIDGRSGLVMFEKNADELMAPASMSKLMTMTLVFEALTAKQLTMDQEFVISEDAWRRGGAPSGGSTMYAELNSKVKLSDLIQGAIIQSANDACIAIAEGMAGSEAAFAQRMTERARALGLEKSVFRNSTGLPDPEHVMTVRELAKLARHIILTYPEYYTYYSKPEFTWNNITQENRNPLLVDYPGADGMKTGYTKEAGYGLVGSVERDNRRLIMVIAGLKSIAERKKEAQRILDWGFKQFKPVTAYTANEQVGRARVWGGERNWVGLVTRQDVRLALSSNELKLATIDLLYRGPLMAPVKAGEPAGRLRFSVSGNTIAEFPLETAQPVGAVESMWEKASDSILILIFGG